MVDHSKKMGHNYNMLTTKESGAKVESVKSSSWDAVLKFASENQRLEGFPGEISEAARQHRPDLEELKAVSKKFGAQMPQSVAPSKG